jgi:hypothetical protein
MRADMNKVMGASFESLLKARYRNVTVRDAYRPGSHSCASKTFSSKEMVVAVTKVDEGRGLSPIVEVLHLSQEGPVVLSEGGVNGRIQVLGITVKTATSVQKVGGAHDFCRLL